MTSHVPVLAERPERAMASSRASRRWIDILAERALRGRLEAIQHGTIELVDGSRRTVFGRATERCALHATLHVRDRRFYGELAFGGSVAAGESFVAGDWDADDLTSLVRIMLANRDVLDGMDGGLRLAGDLARRVLHAASRNTRGGSRRNIRAHYDIGNDFFELFLDPTLTYSCAFFERPEATLEQAQVAKLDRLLRKLDLNPGDHLLEIGTGWGALALHAARRYGCRVTTTTISREQHALARRRIEEAGLADRVTLRLDDYRDVTGQYDKIVSVEMIEAIGHQYFDAFFHRCRQLLKPGGTMALQAITIDERRYAAARDAVDFIKRHIFPGCCIPSLGVLSASCGRASLVHVDTEDIGPHYATTLAIWRRNLHANAERIRALGYPGTLIRLWDFYLAYCEGGYRERELSNVQMVLLAPA